VSGETPSTLGCENDTFGVEDQSQRPEPEARAKD
jgi:hypothetical protein